ncbi:2-hydroxyacid dehydrogenase [Nakamurella deserti]|uniref:2-hydroxyacid dehydrogenase n=1 Tax=Nakamurella deserti TaxID=2164074 RepID=UPI00197B4946|nr:2-hydroxyacid dehydrogenase [Nakamurella deserti]
MPDTPVALLEDPTVARLVGEVPGLTILSGAQPADVLARVEVYVPRFLADGPATDVLANLTNLKLLQLATAGAEAWTGSVPAGVTMATARGAHGKATAEWAVGALIAVLREFPGFVLAQAERRWTQHSTDMLAGRSALVLGAGDLGSEVRTRLEAFGVSVTTVARTARDGVRAIDTLPELLPHHDVVVVMVPLTEATTGLVDAAFLAAMPDGAVLVNAARGKVVDTDALVSELRSGRLRAALDVTEPEPLPAGHPLWEAPGVFITPHIGGSTSGAADRAAAVVRAQLQRYVSGEELQNVVSGAGY